ncbi:MAG TPA: diaminopimelate epimerase [Stellaceae bacterium]|nr:diaminopimelate epimerase [Stellaceae bacterium]
MGRIPFVKMHGLGNDFVVLDARARPLVLDDAAARALADRHTGIGCDQLVLIEPPRDPAADAFLRIRNADGGEAAACGNATRCVALLLGRERGLRRVRIETLAGLIDAEILPDERVAVDMGPARTAWREIPLAREMDTARVELALGPLMAPVCTNIGNPHATFFVADAEAVDLAALGPVLEHDPLFPERANIGVAALFDRRRLRLRVWERGVGLTRACGTAACAALVAACRRDLAERRATVVLDGGALDILWRDDGHVVMTGPAATAFVGEFAPALLTGR